MLMEDGEWLIIKVILGLGGRHGRATKNTGEVGLQPFA